MFQVFGNLALFYIYWGYNPRIIETDDVIQLVEQTVISLLALTTYVLVIKRLCMKGTSTELRRKIIGRHSVYFFLFMYTSVINSIAITANAKGWGIYAFNTDADRDWVITWKDMFKPASIGYVVYYACGVSLALVRLFEPIVYQTFKSDLKILYLKCVRSKKRKRREIVNKDQFAKEGLTQFMNSAMNIEFVYLILIGINTFMEDMGKKEQSHEEVLSQRRGKKERVPTMSKITMDKNQNSTKITFHEVKFADIQDWNIIKDSADQSNVTLDRASDEESIKVAPVRAFDDELLQFKEVPSEHEQSLNNTEDEERITEVVVADPKIINGSDITEQESFKSSNLFKTFQPEVPKKDNSLRISKDSDNKGGNTKFVKAQSLAYFNEKKTKMFTDDCSVG